MKLTSLFLNLSLAKKLLLVSAVPMVAVLVLSLLTYRSVEMFSLDEDHLNDVYHIQSASSEFMRLVVERVFLINGPQADKSVSKRLSTHL